MELKLILLTHAHFDHTGGVAELCAALPGVPVYLHPADAALVGGDVFPAVGAETTPYQDGDVVKLGKMDIEVLHTPGHTPGGVTLKVGDVLLTGDTLFQGSMGRTDFASPATTTCFPATWGPPPWSRSARPTTTCGRPWRDKAEGRRPPEKGHGP